MDNLKRRKKVRYKCKLCNYNSTNFKSTDTHFSRNHICQQCGQTFPQLTEHNCSMEMQNHNITTDISAWKFKQSAQNRILRTYCIENMDSSVSISDLFISKESEFFNLFTRILNELNTVKAKIVLNLKLNKMGIDVFQEVFLHGFSTPVTHISMLSNFLNSQASHIITTVNNYSELGSKWVIVEYKKLIVNFAHYRSINGQGFVEILKCFSRRRGLINVQTNNSYCFHYCVCAKYFKQVFKIYDKRKLSRPILYKKFIASQSIIRFDWEKQGTSIEDICAFEKNYPSWSVNVFSPIEYDTGNSRADIWSVKLCSVEKLFHLNLLALPSSGRNYHYMLIDDFNCFMGKRHNSKQFWCKCCMQKFKCQEKFQMHQKVCQKYGLQTLKFPKATIFKVNSLSYSLMFPVHLIADFETVSVQVESPFKSGCMLKQKVHKACSYSMQVLNFNKVLENEFYFGPDANVRLINRLLEVADKYLPLVFANTFVQKYNRDDAINFENAQICGLCQLPFTVKDPKVFHHCHWDDSLRSSESSYICAAHQSCNLQVHLISQYFFMDYRISKT